MNECDSKIYSNIVQYEWFDIAQEINCEKFVYFFKQPRNEELARVYLKQVIEKNPIYIVTIKSLFHLFEKFDRILYVSDNYFENEYQKHIQMKYYYLPKCIGVTGTYGKSSTVYFAHQILKESYKVYCSSSLGCGIDRLEKGVLTTGSFLSLRRNMHASQAEVAVIEISSHAIDQKRIWNIMLECCIFISIEEDHIDYHKTFEHYLETKLKLKNNTKKYFISQNILNSHKVELSENMHIYPNKNMYYNDQYFYINDSKYEFNVIGWQRYNLFSALVLISESSLSIKNTKLLMPPGRMELVREINDIAVYVDGAHNADQVHRIVSTLTSNWIFVYGASGKRIRIENNELIGQDLRVGTFLNQYGVAIFTDDNPFLIDSNLILQELKNGIIISDRVRAIEYAINLGIKTHSNVLVLGKSTEAYNHIDYKTHIYYYDEVQLINMICDKL